jgi:predicted nucleotide-binding protein (sugar kinase/HSP70/actin superfamily)
LPNVKIGIPRSLFYYKFATLFETFFVKLGIEVIVSDATNKRILDDGVKACVDEACLPIKLFHGHVINLKDRVDFILVPRFTSISKKEYICPEFGGLPDMVRHTVKGLPPLIDTEINLRRSDRGAIKAAIETAFLLGVDKRTAKSALWTAIENYRDFRYQALQGTLPFRMVQGDGSAVLPANGQGDGSTVPPGKTGQKNRPFTPSPVLQTRRMKIALIGHPYNIYDKYISMDLINKINKFGVDVKTIEMVDEVKINRQAAVLSKPMFWNYGRNAYGAALQMAASGEIDGMICVTSFGCGIDSFVNDFIERKVRREYKIPFITLTIDEHSGEAGFNTRLEAFVDMLHWRQTDENNISSSG